MLHELRQAISPGRSAILDQADAIAFNVGPFEALDQLAGKLVTLKAMRQPPSLRAVLSAAVQAVSRFARTLLPAPRTGILRCQVLVAEQTIQTTRGKHLLGNRSRHLHGASPRLLLAC